MCEWPLDGHREPLDCVLIARLDCAAPDWGALPTANVRTSMLTTAPRPLRDTFAIPFPIPCGRLRVTAPPCNHPPRNRLS